MAFYPISVDGDIFVPADTIPASFLVGPIPNQYTQTVILGGLSAGAWFPNEYVGPNFTFDSCSTTNGYFPRGSGFFRVVRNGTLSNFRFTNAQPTGTTLSVDLYIAPAGNPLLFAYSGVSITMVSPDYIANNDVDTLPVFADDIIVFYNPGPIGYTPNGMQITAQFTPA